MDEEIAAQTTYRGATLAAWVIFEDALPYTTCLPLRSLQLTEAYAA